MIKPITMYSVVCDRCGKLFCEGDSIITGADKKSARGDKLYCPDCYEFYAKLFHFRK